jgi:hypothetical protein
MSEAMPRKLSPEQKIADGKAKPFRTAEAAKPLSFVHAGLPEPPSIIYSNSTYL